MTRRKSLLKIISAVLAVLLLAVFFAGCGEYKPPENTGGSSPVTPPVDPNPPKPGDDDEDSFTVTLMLREVIEVTDDDGAKREESVETPFTNLDYAAITKLQAQWTEITEGTAAVYRANFDKNGVAKVSGLDGDFNVTLVLTEDFKKDYCYDPNPARPERKDELVATNYKKDISVPLYEIKEPVSSDYTYVGGVRTNYLLLKETGAYSYTFKSKTDKQMFMYQPQRSGEYSFMTLMDVTADEINPIVDLHYGNPSFINAIPAVTQDGGGAEGSYTKNVWLKYQLADGYVGNVMLFNLYSESEKSDAYPLTIYFIFERDGEYTIPKLESTPVPVTEDFNRTPQKPNGTLQFASESRYFGNTTSADGKHILNQKYVKYNNPAEGGDGYYYYVNPATGDFYKDQNGKVLAQYRIYAVLTEANPVMRGTGEGGSDAYLTYEKVISLYHYVEGADGTAKDYYDFIVGNFGYAKHCNDDGAYPVTAELKQFLQDFAVSRRYFNDGNGEAEMMGVDSDEDSQWLFACGLYSR